MPRVTELNINPETVIYTERCFQVVKPIVETDISRAASSFAKDSTLIKYRSVQYSTVQYSKVHYSLYFSLVSWRNEKATFTEKSVDIKTDKLPGERKIFSVRPISNILCSGHDHAADHIFVGLPEGKQKL